MADAKHTPGPWTDLDIGEIVAGEDHEITIALMNDGDASAGSSAEVEANARLIAAAPDLLAAITAAQDVLAEYIVPDSGISEMECVNRLLSVLDHRDLVVLMRSIT